MASRENMGLQIWLMITVMFAVLMAVVASVFYYTNSSNIQRLAALETQKATDSATISSQNFEIQALKQMIEGPPEGLDEIPLSPGATKDLVDAFKVDMATYASNLDAGDRVYSKIGSHLIAELQNRNEQFKQSTEEQNKIIAARQANEEATKSQLAEAVQQQQMVSDELLTQKTEFE